MAERTVYSRVEALGDAWTPQERQRRLFGLCVYVAATGSRQYGDVYRLSSIAMYPDWAETMVDTVIQEYLCGISSS